MALNERLECEGSMKEWKVQIHGIGLKGLKVALGVSDEDDREPLVARPSSFDGTSITPWRISKLRIPKLSDLETTNQRKISRWARQAKATQIKPKRQEELNLPAGERGHLIRSILTKRKAQND
ncbi:hypothetical protein CR513_29470, partial [Mucuna pruriens]